MSLKEEINQDLKAFLKEKKELEVLTLRQVLSAVLNKEKEKRFILSKENPNIIEEDYALVEEEILNVVNSEVKKRREAIEGFEKGGRMESAQKEKQEMEILKKYLPEQISEEEIKNLVAKAIEKVEAKEIKDMGKVMAELMFEIKGKADPSLVGKIVKESLSQ
ncbi:MAG: GatB/YqeY domain-containing protein [Candidatus Nealsonbacteria bacterium]